MQSSSKLFPVALVSAELRGDLTEDVYLLKPGNSPDGSVALALTRLGHAAAARRGEPLVLLHGAFANRRCWYTAHGHGLGAWLARAGFDVWLAEMRGHGLSPRNRLYRSNRVADYARFDLPAIAAFVDEQCAQPAHWLGHSLGGLSIAAALAGAHLAAMRVASLVLLGCQIRHLHWSLKLPPLSWGARLWLRRREQVGGGWLGLGPEDEPAGIACDALRWYGPFGRFADGRQDWVAALAAVEVPVLALAGAGDHTDPAQACRQLLECFGSSRRAYLRLGRAEGFAEDYGHAGLLAGRHAAREIWPLLEHWLRHRQLPQTMGEESHTFA
ncbi:Esterase/lipase/thioesterase family protein [Pseudomonas sp. OF001]|uniref:alpha/beta fold hydrolase n=1 Tax=Pseudomonas sp. OF001 TaxID=2772300 RepID=UPI00191A7B92|nr:alpha/beta fold hydrolase [Pseudomonas sp. OF001]CAD5377537.1 Esterase/lipase/thioesterase family protein [Pseudomonas sp. OF001]